MYKYSLAYSEKIFFQNKDDANLFRDSGIIKSTHSVVVTHGSGVNIEDYSYYPVDTEGEIVFLMAARLLNEKGVREYLRAAELLKKKYKNVRFVLAGDTDPNPGSIRISEINELHKNGVIDYRGYVKDIRELMILSSVYVLPSYREGTPRSVLEAMATGRAIITTNAPGCKETVIEGENGYKIPIKDADALINAMQGFINNKNKISEMGLSSRLIAEKKYNVQNVNQLIMENVLPV